MAEGAGLLPRAYAGVSRGAATCHPAIDARMPAVFLAPDSYQQVTDASATTIIMTYGTYRSRAGPSLLLLSLT